MARRKSIKTELKEYSLQTVYSVIFVGLSAWGFNRYTDSQIDWLFPLIVGPALPIVLRVLDSPRLKMRPQTSFAFGYVASRPSYQINKRKGLFESLVKWSDGGYNPEPEPDRSNSYQIRYDEPKRSVFQWNVQLSNRLEPVTIDEDDLHGFVSEVSKRQRQGKYYPLARNYFTQRRRPQMSEPEYRAMIEI